MPNLLNRHPFRIKEADESEHGTPSSKTKDTSILSPMRKNNSGIRSLKVSPEKERLFLDLLREGATFLKHSKYKKPQPCLLTLSQDLREIQWNSHKDWKGNLENLPSTRKRENSVELSLSKKSMSSKRSFSHLSFSDRGETHKSQKVSDFMQVSKGCGQNDLFRRHIPQLGMENDLEKLAFSLIFKDKSLHLEASSEIERDDWVEALRWLCQNHGKGSVSIPFNVQHVTHVDSEFIWTGEDLENVIEIKKKLGQGAYGEVFLGKHIKAKFELAIKMLDCPVEDPDVLKKQQSNSEFQKEIDILRQCRHPNLVNLYGVWGPNKLNRIWIMMDLCQYGSIGDLLGVTETPLTEAQLKWLILCALRGLAYLHSRRIFHRDIKPGNILVDRGGICKIADFGVSHQLTRTKTISRKMIGSPLYMSPELIKSGEGSLKADIWALGITAIELADGENPYSDLSAFSAIFGIQQRPSPVLNTSKGWSEEFHQFISKMVEKDPNERYNAFDLLKHPWLNDASSKSMIDLLLRNLEHSDQNPALLKAERLEVMKQISEVERIMQGCIPNPPPKSKSAPLLIFDDSVQDVTDEVELETDENTTYEPIQKEEKFSSIRKISDGLKNLRKSSAESNRSLILEDHISNNALERTISFGSTRNFTLINFPADDSQPKESLSIVEAENCETKPQTCCTIL